MKTKNLKKKINREVHLNTYTPGMKLDFRISKDALEMFIGYVFSRDPDITKMNLHNMDKLINMIEMRSYEIDAVLHSRILVLKNALDGKLKQGLERVELLKEYCRVENNEDVDYVIDHIDDYMNLTKREIKFITEAVVDRLQFAFILFYKDVIINEFMRIDQGDYKSFKEVCKAVKIKCEALLSEIRRSENVLARKMFSLEPGVFEAFVEDTVKRAADPNTSLMTGIRMLNEMLSPGFMPGRLYLFLACSGVFKSAMLLLVTYWIKKYNHVEPKDPECTPTVLLIVAENSLDETIIRLFNASVTNEDITKFDPKEVVDLLRTKGNLTLNAGEINIVMVYAENEEYSPNDIKSLIEDLKSDKKEVIACVIDYLKRVRSDKPYETDRIKYRDISNGIKDLSVYFSIPFISAYQINRSGNNVVEQALNAGKENLGRLLGKGDIADCWDLIENSDLVMLLNVEIEKLTGIRYLTIKELKKRYRSMTDVTYFNHPFAEGSTIMLVEDVGLQKSVSKLSIASDLGSAPMTGNNRGSTEPIKDTGALGIEFDFDNDIVH